MAGNVEETEGVGTAQPFKAALTEQLALANRRRLESDLDPITVQGMARDLKRSIASVYSWFSGSRKPSDDLIEPIAKLLTSSFPELKGEVLQILTSARSSSESGGTKHRHFHGPAYVDSAEIRRRQKDARELWILKWNRAFLTDRDPELYGALDQAIESSDERLRWNYVFPGTHVKSEIAQLDAEWGELYAPDDLNAYRSFFRLIEQIRLDKDGLTDEALGKVIRGREIKSLRDVFRLGIPRLDMGIFMIEYTKEAVDRLKRRADIFLEVFAPSDGSPSDTQPSGSAKAPPETYWVELDQSIAADLHQRLISVLKDIEPIAPRNLWHNPTI